jgi:DNA-binding SARP family transcriptional activator
VGRGLAITGFGRFSVVVDGEDRTAALSPRARRSLAHLALHEEAIDRRVLAAELWPDMPEATALGSLRRRLHELESALEGVGCAGALERTRGTVALSPPLRWAIDVARYAVMARDAMQAERAAAIYREPIFPGLEDEIIERQRRRLHAVQIELLARLLDAAILRADAAAIAARADALIRLDPLSEQSIAGAMAALETLGETDRARRLRERLTSAMRDEIDAEPSVFDFDAGITADHVRRVLLPLVERGDVLRGPDAGRHFDEIERRLPELRSALDSAIVHEGDLQTGVRALAALSRFFFDRGHALEALRWYRAAIRRLPESSPLHAEALYLAAVLGRNLGHAEHNLPAFERAIEALRRTGDRSTLAKAMLYGSNAARMTGRVGLADALAREAQGILEERDDAYLIAFARSAVGAAAYARGDLDTARAEFERARDGFAGLGAHADEALMIVDIGRCLMTKRGACEARDYLERALGIAVATNTAYVEGHARIGLALVAIESGELPAASAHAARAGAIALRGSDTELSVIALEASGELFLALGEFARARDALAAADGVRSEYLIARAPTEHRRSERLRASLAERGMLVAAPVAAPDIMMRSLLESVSRSYGRQTL